MARAQPRRDAARTVLQEEVAALDGAADDNRPTSKPPPLVQGGRERAGLILHKLMEEVLTGETPEAEAARPNGPATSSTPSANLRSPIRQRDCRPRSWRPVWPGPWRCPTSRPFGQVFWPIPRLCRTGG